jgi:hypothetical protein
VVLTGCVLGALAAHRKARRQSRAITKVLRDRYGGE